MALTKIDGIKQNIISSDFSVQPERIKAILDAQVRAEREMRTQYNSAKNYTKLSGKIVLESILSRLYEHEKYINELVKQEKQCSELLPLLGKYRQHTKKVRAFFEAEFLKEDPDFTVMPQYLKRIKDSKAEFSFCISSLLYALVFLSNSESMSHFDSDQLRAIACAHNNSLLNLAIEREALRRAKHDISYVELVSSIVVGGEKIASHDDGEERESADHLYHNTEILAQELKQFVIHHKKADVALESDAGRGKKKPEPSEPGSAFTDVCQLIKVEIETKLKCAIDSTPWPLGWAGSRFSIEYNGKNFYVPQGIYELYHLVKKPEEHSEQIKATLSAKTARISSIYSFFSTLIGTARSEETQKTYEHFNSIVSLVK